jgi:hypothetical protein
VLLPPADIARLTPLVNTKKNIFISERPKVDLKSVCYLLNDRVVQRVLVLLEPAGHVVPDRSCQRVQSYKVGK